MVSVRKGLLVAAGTVVGLAGAAWATQALAARRLRRAPDGDSRRVLDTPLYVDHRIPSHDGGVIYAVEHGDGPTILLSHGVTLSSRTWFHQLELLPKEGFRVVAFDHRGHGESQLGQSAEHSLDNLAQDVRSVLLELDLHDAVLVGHSMGGVAAMAFAVQYPELARERLRGLVLLSTLARSPLGSRPTRLKHQIEKLVGRVPDTTPLWRHRDLGLVLARVGFGTDPAPSNVELVRRMMVSCPHETRIDAPRVLVGLDLTADLGRVDIPTLVIVGSADVLTPPATARHLARSIPGARLEVVAGGGHVLMLERAEQVNRLIADFAREVGARP